jgi:4-amino-4-deoxy-L-arabinose transferase-like glycosyltransferase
VSHGRWARPVALAIVAALLALLVWDVAHFPWRRGYDATAAAHYAETLGQERRLPTAEDTDVWHNPPLWFALAGAVYRAAETAGIGDPGLPVQLLSVLCVVGICLLTALLARELFPARRWLPVVALGCAALTPVLVRAGVLFHPEPFAALLATAALVAFVRAVRRESLTLATGAGVGLLIGLANLTRTWALAGLVALLVGAAWLALRERTREARRFALGLGLVAALLVVPWLGIKTAVHGSPLAYSQPDPSQWRQQGRPASFWVGLPVREVLETPYQPFFRNRLLPTVYADWWGDYWRVFRVPPALKEEPDRLPQAVAAPLVRQSWVGLVGLGFTLLGVVVLVVTAVHGRDPALGTVLLSAALLLASFAAFLARYPKQDGDNIKALYLLNGAPVAALACAVGLSWLADRGGWWRGATIALAGVAALVTVAFLTLPRG